MSLLTTHAPDQLHGPPNHTTRKPEIFFKYHQLPPRGGVGLGGTSEFACTYPCHLALSSGKIFSVSFPDRKTDPVPEMTTPERFYSKVMETLKYLHSHLPNGSHVILYGLPDGTFLWDNLHDRYHPLGIALKLLLLFNFFLRFYIMLCLERGRGKEGEKHQCVVPPYWGPGPQPRHVP